MKTDHQKVTAMIRQNLRLLSGAPPELRECFDESKLKKLATRLRVRQRGAATLKQRRQKLEQELQDFLLVAESMYMGVYHTRQIPGWLKTKHKPLERVFADFFVGLKKTDRRVIAQAEQLAGRQAVYYRTIHAHWREFRRREKAAPREASQKQKLTRRLNRVLRALID